MFVSFIKGLLEIPYEFVSQILGLRKLQFKEDVHIYRLGKKCNQCNNLILHQDAISVCQCYCFAHKNCLKNQLRQLKLSECSVFQCKSCRDKVKVLIDTDYSIELNWSIRKFVIMLICAVLSAISMFYLIDWNIYRKQMQNRQKIATGQQQKTPPITTEQCLALGIIFIFGTMFWLCLIGIFLKKEIIIKQIVGTNSSIKISAFEQIQSKLREESRHEIFSRKDQADL